MASVELRNLTKRYGDVAVVDDISLTIEHGHLVCLLGPSGCGKTTTLRLIAGFVEPSDGEIRVGDKLISSPAQTLPPERRNMSMIFQSYALWPHMTVAENIVYGLKLRKMDRDTIAKKLDAILATTQLAPLAAALSGRIVRRPAAARGARARADRRAGNAAARRTAFQSRRQFARGNALRGAPPARRLSLHDGLRHPRPVGGDDHRRPDLRHECTARSSSRARRKTSTTGRARNSSRALSDRATSSKARAWTIPAIDFAGTALRCVGEKISAGAPTPVSIRPHDIAISAAQPTGRKHRAGDGGAAGLSRRQPGLYG